MPSPSSQKPARSDTQFVAGHFPRPVAKQLRQIAVDEDKTVQALLEEAIDHLFKVRGRPGLADLSSGGGTNQNA